MRFTTFLTPVLVLCGCQSQSPSPSPSSSPRVETAPVTQPVSRGAEYQPKVETGAADFLKAHPSMDGRGIVVAIFDTGVDPGADGLQVTSDGRPKIIDIVDGTGSGDVDTSTVVTADEGMIDGLSGRTLLVPGDWNNPSGEWHIGIKAAWDLYPGQLVSRMKQERRRTFKEQHRAIEAGVSAMLEQHRVAHEEETDTQRRDREELEARLELLSKGQDDPGPVFDCVVFNDGEHWRAVVDTDEDGDLADEALLSNYRLNRSYATFGEDDLLNFCVNIYEDGNLLSIVADAGAHGTHVAGTVAAHFPGQPELDGIAPGAQIVGVKIGDTRLGSTSLGTGEVRGLIAVLRNKCDLINMSYGGSTGFPNSGRVIDMYKDIVNEHGVIFVASAGNAGPNLTTVGAPGGTTTEVIGVGAVLTPAMMHDQYAITEPYDTLHYTWSSRGPTSDGDLGVVISAPGGAISPVPNWQLKRHALMNGTSMSSPNLCGCLALLCSGLKASDQSWTPHSIRRAIENTAQPIAGMDRFSLGAGMINVPGAWDYLLRNSERDDDAVQYRVTTSDRHEGRGIYLRESWETDRKDMVRVKVSPEFPRDDPKKDRVDFERSIRFEATAEWIDAPDSVMLVHGGREFRIGVDPTQLDPGAHFGEVLGFDARDAASGPLFRVPVTVLKPVHLDAADGWKLSEQRHYEAGDVQRWFLDVPHGATWIDLEIKRLVDTASRRLVVQATQLLPDRPYTDTNLRRYITLDDDDRSLISVPAIGGRVMELTIAQYWSSLQAGDYQVTVSAHGLVPSSNPVSIDGNRLTTRVDVQAPLGPEMLDPSAELTFVRRWLQSKKRVISPLGKERDELPEGRRIHQMVLDYDFELDEDASIRVWEADLPETRDLESTMVLIYDESMQLMLAAVGDDWHSLDKGTYLARYHVRHDDRSSLEDLEDLPLRFDRKLKKPLRVATRSHPAGGSHDDRILRHGESEAIHLVSPSPGKQNDAAEPGDLLIGTIHFGASASDTVGAGRNPDGYPLELTVATNPIKMKKPSKAEDEVDVATSETLADAVRETRLKHAIDFSHEEERDEFQAFVRERLEADGEDLDVLELQLDWTVKDETLEEDDHARRIITASNTLLDSIDVSSVAAWHGMEHDEDDRDASDKEASEEMDQRRDLIIKALHARAGAESDLIDVGMEQSRENREAAFEETWKQLEQWTDPSTTDDGYLVAIDRERRRGRLATAIAMVDSRLKKHPRERSLHELRLELLEELGWNHLAERQQRDLLRRFPDSYQPF
ncbi:MAG: S8 family serine peptidase [Planctomycetota bacterium]|nr:S8 family serine peptidase [Planctomycetota bacterium]